MAKEPTNTAAAGETKALSPDGKPDGPGVPGGTEPKFGKVEARVAALEAYIAHNVKTLGWPEFKG